MGQYYLFGSRSTSNVGVNITPIYVLWNMKWLYGLFTRGHGMENTRCEGRWVTWIYLTDCLALSWDIVFTQHRLHQDNEQSPISWDRWHTGGCMTPAKINFIRGEINVVSGPVNIPHKGDSWDQIKFSDCSGFNSRLWSLIARTNRRVWGLRGRSLPWPGIPHSCLGTGHTSYC